MKRLLFCLAVVFCLGLQAQDSTAIWLQGSLLQNLQAGDSITYYQCHVEEAVQQITTASGQTLTGKPDRYTITEKYVVTKQENGYSVNYYSSAMTSFPNRRFSALKIREKDYWLFKKEKSFAINNQDLRVLAALERKGHEATEYDFAITKYTPNQLIIKRKKYFKQLVIEGNYILSKLILH